MFEPMKGPELAWSQKDAPWPLREDRVLPADGQHYGSPNKTGMEQNTWSHSHSGDWVQWKPPIRKDTGAQPSYNSQDHRKQTSKGPKVMQEDAVQS